MGNSIEVKRTETNKELNAVFDIRRKVFVEEQMVDEREEYDDFEETSTHIIGLVESAPCGTARVRRTANGVKLERFAVLQEARGLGLGAALLKEALDIAKTYDNIYLHAQIQVVGFYEKFGFVKEGEEFIEANIRHYKMTYKP